MILVSDAERNEEEKETARIDGSPHKWRCYDALSYGVRSTLVLQLSMRLKLRFEIEN